MKAKRRVGGVDVTPGRTATDTATDRDPSLAKARVAVCTVAVPPRRYVDTADAPFRFHGDATFIERGSRRRRRRADFEHRAFHGGDHHEGFNTERVLLFRLATVAGFSWQWAYALSVCGWSEKRYLESYPARTVQRPQQGARQGTHEEAREEAAR